MGKNQITSSGELSVRNIYWLLYLPDTTQRTDIRKRSCKNYIYKCMIAQNACTGRNISSIGYVCRKPYVQNIWRNGQTQNRNSIKGRGTSLFCFPKPTQPGIQWLTRAISSGVKQPSLSWLLTST